MTFPRRAIFMLSFDIPPNAQEGDMLDYITCALVNEHGRRSCQDPMADSNCDTLMLTPLTHSPSVEIIRRHLTNDK